jgi:hypothetical protein
VYDGVPRNAYFALADEAKLQHIDFEGHVPEAVTAQEASAAGQRSMEHLTGIALACSSKQETLNAAIEHARFFLDRLRVEAEGYRSFDQAKCQALFCRVSSERYLAGADVDSKSHVAHAGRFQDDLISPIGLRSS